MKEIVKLGFILFMFCAVASGILAFVNGQTKDTIAANKMKVENEARAEVLPNVTFEGPLTAHAGQPDSLKYYVGKNDKGEIVGYTFVAAGRGYSSVVRSMVALSPELKVVKMKVIDQNETPGLGSNSTKPDFGKRYEGKEAAEMVVDKDGGKVQSITGSTITTRAITKSIRLGMEILKETVAQTTTTSTPGSNQ